MGVYLCSLLYRLPALLRHTLVLVRFTQINSTRQLLCTTITLRVVVIVWPPPPSFLPSPVFSCLPSLPVGQSEDRSDGSSSGSGAGAGPGESSVLSATDAPGVCFSWWMVAGVTAEHVHRAVSGRLEIKSADVERLKSVWTMFNWGGVCVGDGHYGGGTKLVCKLRPCVFSPFITL